MRDDIAGLPFNMVIMVVYMWRLLVYTTHAWVLLLLLSPEVYTNNRIVLTINSYLEQESYLGHYQARTVFHQVNRTIPLGVFTYDGKYRRVLRSYFVANCINLVPITLIELSFAITIALRQRLGTSTCTHPISASFQDHVVSLLLWPEYHGFPCRSIPSLSS